MQASVCECVCEYMSVYVSVCASVYVRVQVSECLHVGLCKCMSVSLCFYVSVCIHEYVCMCISLCEHMCVKALLPSQPFPHLLSLQQWAWGRFWKEPGQPLGQRRLSDPLVPGQPGPQQRKHQAPPAGGAALGPASCTNRGPPVCSLCTLPGETTMPTPTTCK